MKILLNDQILELKQPLSISSLLQQLECKGLGNALAINQTIIPRTDWPTHIVQDGDNVMLFQAIAGG